MLPQKHFDKMEKVEKAAAELLNNAKLDPLKSKDIVEIKENTIDKHIKSTTVSDDEYDDDYDYNYPDDDTDSDTDTDEIVTITPKVVSTTKCKWFYFLFFLFLFSKLPTRFFKYQTYSTHFILF